MRTRRKDLVEGVSQGLEDRPNGTTARVGDWLESPYVPRLATRVAAQYHLLAADVPDLLQEILIALWKSDPNLVVAAGWIHRLAVFKAVDIIRKQRHEAPSSSRALRDAAAGAGLESASESEAAHLLHARVAHLPARMQTFWRLRYEAGLTQEEVAARFGLSRTAIRWLDSQLRKTLGARKVESPQPGRKPGH